MAVVRPATEQVLYVLTVAVLLAAVAYGASRP